MRAFSRVSMIGSGIADDEGLFLAISESFRDVARGPLWRANSGLRVSGLVPRTRAEQTVAQLHERLRLEEPHATTARRP